MARQSKRFLVTPSGFDDIGAVLDDMGEGFEHEEVDWDDLRHFKSLQGCEVLFINCASESGDDDYAREIASVIRKFVERGGSLYCSCWAISIVEASFRGLFKHYGDYSGTVRAHVLDPGLQELLGKKIDLTLTGWWPTRPSSKFDGRTLLEGDLDDDFNDDDELNDDEWDHDDEPRNLKAGPIPLLTTFQVGAGHVIYTAFHNEEQTSEDEKKLLRYLVLRPILAKAAAGAAQMARAQQCVPGKEIIATIDRNKRSAPYIYQATGGEGLMYVLHWTEAGKLRLTVNDPNGKIVHRAEGDRPPLRYEMAAAGPGNWSCHIEAVSVAHDNFPYVLTLATRTRTPGQPVTPKSPQPAQPKAAPQTGGQETLWPCYILIDCSKLASDVAPKIGQGIGIFLRDLRAISTSGITPAVSFVECREGNSTIGPVRRLAELSPLSLSCMGELKLEPLLNRLISAIESSPSQTRGKPFVVVVLATEPRDNFQSAANRLRQMAVQGRVNVMVVGVDSGVSDATLTRVATIPLRVIQPHGDGTTQCFDWLGQVAATMMAALTQSGSATVNLPPLPAGVKWLR